jgi:hypothetical protein
MYIKKSNGPNIEPCGTLIKVGALKNLPSSITTICALSLTDDLINVIESIKTPQYFYLPRFHVLHNRKL